MDELNRRNFLKMSVAGIAGGLLVPGWLAEKGIAREEIINYSQTDNSIIFTLDYGDSEEAYYVDSIEFERLPLSSSSIPVYYTGYDYLDQLTVISSQEFKLDFMKTYNFRVFGDGVKMSGRCGMNLGVLTLDDKRLRSRFVCYSISLSIGK